MFWSRQRYGVTIPGALCGRRGHRAAESTIGEPTLIRAESVGIGGPRAATAVGVQTDHAVDRATGSKPPVTPTDAGGSPGALSYSLDEALTLLAALEDAGTASLTAAT